ncbi:MAG: hypothetical protein P1V20_04965 [Verrucomicrobiales bacterium]|nr:hypothetical protein [Verrucomicrobiales bacterium]
MFWSSQTIKRKQGKDWLIKRFRSGRVKHGSYELSLGETVYLTSAEKGTTKAIEKREQIGIPPGQFGILITEEEVRIPPDVIAFISIKARKKFRGLVNVSGFHVDPGFTGKLKFSVFNAGAQTMILERGEPLFLIWFASFDQAVEDPYNGSHKNQIRIDGEDAMKIQGKLASPAILDERLQLLEVQFKIWSKVIITILIGIGVLLLKFLLVEVL